MVVKNKVVTGIIAAVAFILVATGMCMIGGHHDVGISDDDGHPTLSQGMDSDFITEGPITAKVVRSGKSGHIYPKHNKYRYP